MCLWYVVYIQCNDCQPCKRRVTRHTHIPCTHCSLPCTHCSLPCTHCSLGLAINHPSHQTRHRPLEPPTPDTHTIAPDADSRECPFIVRLITITTVTVSKYQMQTPAFAVQAGACPPPIRMLQPQPHRMSSILHDT